MLIVGYVLLSLLVALNGRNRRCGILGALCMGLLITPVIAFLVLWMTAPRIDRTGIVVHQVPPEAVQTHSMAPGPRREQA